MPHLILIRGKPDSGKTTLGKQLCDAGVVQCVYAADDYFDLKANRLGIKYAQAFDPNELRYAHRQCQDNVYNALAQGKSVAVCNTFTQRRELQPYIDMARGYRVPLQILTTERHELFGTTNGHQVPEEALRAMHGRWQWIDRRGANDAG